MTARDFCYWLQGMFELNGPTALNEAQTTCIRNHLNLVFVHDIDTPDPDGTLQAAHDGTPPSMAHMVGSGKTVKRC